MPVFIDADPVTGNARCEQLESAYKPGKTKAVMMAHALGNPFDMAKTLSFCQKYNLWLDGRQLRCPGLQLFHATTNLAEEFGHKWKNSSRS